MENNNNKLKKYSLTFQLKQYLKICFENINEVISFFTPAFIIIAFINATKNGELSDNNAMSSSTKKIFGFAIISSLFGLFSSNINAEPINNNDIHNDLNTNLSNPENIVSKKFAIPNQNNNANISNENHRR